MGGEGASEAAYGVVGAVGTALPVSASVRQASIAPKSVSAARVAGDRSTASLSTDCRSATSLPHLPTMWRFSLARSRLGICRTPTHDGAPPAHLRRGTRRIIHSLPARALRVTTGYRRRPQLRDAGDELVLEATVAGGADALVTFNACDFGDAPRRFGTEVMGPADLLRRVT